MDPDSSQQPNFDATPGGVNGALLNSAIDNFGDAMDADSSQQPNDDQGASDPLFQYELATNGASVAAAEAGLTSSSSSFLSSIPSWTWYALGGLALALVVMKR